MLGLGLGINRGGGALSSPAKKAGAVMHLDVSDLVSSTVIRDKQQGNNATLYNFAGTADSGIANNEYQYTFTNKTTPLDNNWQAIAFGSGVFVAVASAGSGNRVMLSTDAGETWTSRVSPIAGWRDIAYGDGVFVAVAVDGAGNRVMVSTDLGETWTSKAASDNANSWHGITYAGSGRFVAVANSGGGKRVMVSTDYGNTWTGKDAVNFNGWLSVAHGAGVLVAVAFSGASGFRAMRSTDLGETWTGVTIPESDWRDITYGNGVFVTVAFAGASHRILTSNDGGLTWTGRNTSSYNGWLSVGYGDGLFVAVSVTGTSNRITTSPDAINWTSRSAPTNEWWSVCYGASKFVTVGTTGTGNRVMSMPYTYDLAFGSRPCINGDGIDDHLRVLTQSAGLNIASGTFALAMTLRLKNNTAGWLIAKNTDADANAQYGIYYSGTGGLQLWLNGVSRLSIPAAIAINTWVDIVFTRGSDGVLKLYINGSQHATTATYGTDLVTATNFTIFARSNGTTGTVFASAYMNNMDVYNKSDITSIKKHRAPLCTKYGITYT